MSESVLRSTVALRKEALKLLSFLFSLLVSSSAFSAELYEFSRPVRSLGMGGVYLPFVSSTDAVLWNPAVLASVSEFAWEVGDIGVGLNGQDALRFKEALEDESCDGAACFGDLYGIPIWLGAHGASKFVTPRFGVAVFTNGMISGMLNNPAFPNLDLTYINDYGVAAAYGFPLAPQLNAGLTLKRTNRRGGSQQVSLSTVTSGGESVLDEFDQRGTAYGIDLGLQWTLLGLPETVVALHWQDVGSTAFAPDGSQTAPDRIRDNLSLGVGQFIDLPGLDLRYGLEYRHITLAGEQLGKKLHVGAELSLPLVDVRAGLYQGYPTLGAGVDFFFLRLDAATYTEETGVYPGQTPSQRYKVGLSINLAMDADFSFRQADGKPRRLKQRR